MQIIFVATAIQNPPSTLAELPKGMEPGKVSHFSLLSQSKFLSLLPRSSTMEGKKIFFRQFTPGPPQPTFILLPL